MRKVVALLGIIGFFYADVAVGNCSDEVPDIRYLAVSEISEVVRELAQRGVFGWREADIQVHVPIVPNQPRPPQGGHFIEGVVIMTDMKKVEVLRSFGFERQDAEALINKTKGRIEFGDFVAQNEDGHVVIRELVYDGPRDPHVELDEYGYEITIIPSATACPVAVLL